MCQLLYLQAELADAELKSTEKKAEENNQRLCQVIRHLTFCITTWIYFNTRKNKNDT